MTNPHTRRSSSAVLLGLEDIRGLYAARTLAAHGVITTGITRDRRAYGCRTRTCSDIVVAETRTDEFIDTLVELGPTFRDRPLLVPCTDMTVLHLSRRRDEVEPWYRHTLPPEQVVETLSDKLELHLHGEAHGLAIPRGQVIRSDGDVETAISTLRFPVALKPRNSKDPRWLSTTNEKAFRIDDPKQLVQMVDRHRDAADGMLVQEWIEGPDSELYACHGYFGADSEPLATFVSRKIRQWPPSTGQGCLAHEVDDEHVRDIALDLFRSIGFSGLGYVEVKRDTRSGEYLIVEPNISRVSGRMAIAEAGGVELLGTMYADAFDLPLPSARTQRNVGAKWIYLRQDLQSAAVRMARGELTPRQWMQSIAGPKQYAVWSRDDPMPLAAEYVEGIRKFWQRHIGPKLGRTLST